MPRFDCFLVLANVTACLALVWANGSSRAEAREADRVMDIWPNKAPGETTRDSGATLPRRANEEPPATRVTGITFPQLQMFEPPANRKNGVAVLIFPGGGYNYVVVDKEGSEAAEWLNQHGVTAFVVRYRTKPQGEAPAPLWLRPLQDGQRAMSLVRQQATTWGLKPDRIGVLGFSAGGQAAALLTTRFATRAYEPVDTIDQQSSRPDFSLLAYPWQLVDGQTGDLSAALTISREIPPTFLVHAHDDAVTSLSSVLLYAALKRNGIPAELHIYERGGHGYGMRPVENSDVDTWPQRAEDWLRNRKLID